MTAIHALSIHAKGLSHQIVTEIEIKNPYSGDIIQTKAIWDTGATNTVVTEETAKNIGLISFGKANVAGVHGLKIVNRYFVNITLNNKSISLDIPVTECSALSVDGSIGVLIGMDIITLGDFAITNFGGNTVMTFRVPSLQEIDFVKGINQSKPVVSAKLPSRNDLCPCGSGKKFKNCCDKK